MRQLKFHEQKLLKRVDLVQADESSMREVHVVRRYHLPNREVYMKYNKLCGHIRKLASKISNLDGNDPYRHKITDDLLDKLVSMGVLPTKKSLSQCEKVTVSAFCRRRLPVVMVRLKMAESIKEAVTFIEQGHVRVGPDMITDPAFLVTRAMEDFVTWVDTSKIRQKVLKYNDKLDDYDLMA